MKFFSYDRFGDFELHDTAEAAKRSAEESLTAEREMASQCGEGWADEVTEICWGELREKALEQDRRPVDSSEGSCDPQGAAFIVDYVLQPVVAPVTADGLELARTLDSVADAADHLESLNEKELRELQFEQLRAGFVGMRVALQAASRFIRSGARQNAIAPAACSEESALRGPFAKGVQWG